MAFDLTAIEGNIGVSARLCVMIAHLCRNVADACQVARSLTAAKDLFYATSARIEDVFASDEM